ncbi:mitochondrial enolase superfamily member 1 [Grus japonensis]|uniref:Mitochondrial enolase superfamily member 1 n=1 Tax=Grus japonensis TaxID=30415 RepID=A0ABC9VT05_GRUJA
MDQNLPSTCRIAQDDAECTLSRFADDTRLRGVADMPEGHAAIQRDLERLEKWANRNLMKFNKEKCKVLHLGRKKPRHVYMLRATKLGSSLAEKELGVLVDTKFDVNQQCALAANKAIGVVGCIRQSVASRLREVRPNLEYYVQFWAPQYKRCLDIL